MGHLTSKSVYHKLQQRLDLMWVGGPDYPAFLEILRQLFTEEEAQIASRMPVRFASLQTIHRRTGKPISELKVRLDAMAEKGLVLDLHRGEEASFYVLLPTVIGFFEFSMMRVRHDYDQHHLASLYHDYMLDDPRELFLRQAFQQETQLVRTLVHETALDESVCAEVLNYEKASWIIQNAKQCAVSLCHCRHVKEHLGAACEHPLRACLTLGSGTEYFIRHQLAEPIETREALDILAQSREMGMVQIADNVKNEVGFICNCCGCSCSILETFNRLRLGTKLTYTSNFIAVIDADKCTGCGRCISACPIHAIEFQSGLPGHRKVAGIDSRRCLGCGVCVRACNHNYLRLEPRAARVFTPENGLERILLMALERNKFQNLLFDDLESLPVSILNHLFGWILKRERVKKFLLKEKIRSKWIEFALAYAQKNN
ncbi:4Fe-4S dicluster domain-containing protein [candidate division KSB1 bacterium]|nr:4Fe-4S dicluster domain-containing protein [candidate division KSB1 bacterium]